MPAAAWARLRRIPKLYLSLCPFVLEYCSDSSDCTHVTANGLGIHYILYNSFSKSVASFQTHRVAVWWLLLTVVVVFWSAYVLRSHACAWSPLAGLFWMLSKFTSSIVYMEMSRSYAWEYYLWPHVCYKNSVAGALFVPRNHKLDYWSAARWLTQPLTILLK